MPSRLSSLLVRDGLVGVKRMEKAFQRQVIYGGSLDTILLEMGLVPEERLTQYLALASGLPPAGRDDGAIVDPEAAEVISRELAEQYRAVPIAFEEDAIRVLVCSPLELTELEDLADLLDRPLQPLIAPEFRWNLVYAAAYNLDPPARFTTLARAVSVDPTPAPVGRAQTIIVDEPVLSSPSRTMTERTPPPTFGEGRLAPVPPDARTMKVVAGQSPLEQAMADAAPPHAEAARNRRHTIMGVLPNRATTDGVVVNPRSTDDDNTPPSGMHRRKPTAEAPAQQATLDRSGPFAPFITLPSAGGPATERVSSSHATSPPAVTAERISGGYANGPATERVSLPPGSSSPPPSSSSSDAGGGIPTPIGTSPSGAHTARPSGGLRAPAHRPSGPIAARGTPITTEGRDSPLPIVRAREILATADDRDTVFLTLLRAARSRARWAGLLTVQGGAAIGRVALAEHGLDTSAVHTVLIPLDAVSPFRTVIGNHQPHIGPLMSGDPGIDSMVLRMGGTMPPSALLLPIVLRDRVVALVVAHRLHSDLKLVDVTELLPMATAASDALGRLIVRHKAAGYRAPSEPAAVEAEVENVDTKRISRVDAQWRTPESPPSVPRFEQGVELSIEAGEPRPIDEVLSEIERAGEGEALDAVAEAVERPSETLRGLVRRFPGKLRIDRFAVTGRTLRPAQYGGLLELVVRMGAISSDLLIDRMSAPQRDIRFYATLCAAELRPRSAVFALAERLFDQDFGVRAGAIEALSGYPVTELGHALVRARRAVHSTDPDVVGAAAGALVALGDTEAVPDLIGVIERNDRGGEHARRALTQLTAQDFGASERKWRKWHEGARRRHRIEWLIEGLGHKEDAIRENAINVLRRLTGEYFGYHHDLPRKERDASAERWLSWWRDTGHRRFSTDSDNERHRPTAELPGRREP